MNNTSQKDNLAKHLLELDKQLEAKKLKWNLGMFFGYSVGIFILFLVCNNSVFDNLVYALVTFWISIFLGGIIYCVNLLVWSKFFNSVDEMSKSKNKLEKDWQAIVNKEKTNSTVPTFQLDTIPNKYLDRDYSDIQIEYIMEAFSKYGLTETDIDYFLGLKDEPLLLMEYSGELRYEIDVFVDEVAREKAAESVFKRHNIDV